MNPESVFVNIKGAQASIPNLTGLYDNLYVVPVRQAT